MLLAVHRGPVKRFHPSTTLDVVATVMARVLPSIGCGGWKNCGVGLPFPDEETKKQQTNGRGNGSVEKKSQELNNVLISFSVQHFFYALFLRNFL